MIYYRSIEKFEIIDKKIRQIEGKVNEPKYQQRIIKSITNFNEKNVKKEYTNERK